MLLSTSKHTLTAAIRHITIIYARQSLDFSIPPFATNATQFKYLNLPRTHNGCNCSIGDNHHDNGIQMAFHYFLAYTRSTRVSCIQQQLLLYACAMYLAISGRLINEIACMNSLSAWEAAAALRFPPTRIYPKNQQLSIHSIKNKDISPTRQNKNQCSKPTEHKKATNLMQDMNLMEPPKHLKRSKNLWK